MELVKINIEDKELLERLMQFYLHDISFYFPMQFSENTCTFVYDFNGGLDKYFVNIENIAYFIKQNSKIVGFVFIDIYKDENVIQEFFILNPNKRKGIGKEVAFYIFDKYKGSWTVKSLPCSESVEKFWDKIIKEYTNNNYSVEHIGNYNRAVFKFKNN